MNIVMYSADYFPPKQMNANHNRLHRLAKGLSKKHNVVIFCPNKYYCYDESEFDGIKIIRIPNINIRFIKRVFQSITAYIFIKKKLKNFSIDIFWYNSAHSFLLSKKFRCLKIFDVMGLIQLESTKKDNSILAKLKQTYYKKIENKVLQNSNYIITVNEAHKKTILKIIKKDIFVLRDGFDKLFLKPYKKKEDNTIRITFVGSLFKDRLNGIIEKFSTIIKRNNNIYFEIIGDGTYIRKYKEIISKNNCKKNVKFSGYLENNIVYSHLKNSDICFSDDWSYIGFPTKVFEYMAMGKAVLVEDTPAVREIVKDGINGILYKDPDDFVDKLLMLAKNKKLRKKIGKNAKKDAKNHTWDVRAKQFNKIIKEICDDKKMD
ncbi:MAG: galactosyl-transferase RfpB-like protein [Candidatus Woesearchaeota archaeon]|nr:MAG: galactosyl-transferase RfpB-like protein [Candidatus Woesearchaeota archaeon]